MLKRIAKIGFVALILSVIVIILSGCDGCDTYIKTGKGKVIVNGVRLKHKRTIHLEEEYELPSIKLNVGSGVIDVSGNKQKNISLDVVIYEKEPNDASVYLKDNLLKTESIEHHPVYIDSIGGCLPGNISLDLSAGSGDIYVKNFNFSPKISVSTGSGDNEIVNCTNIESIIAGMGSGDIVLDGMENLKHLNTDSGSGDVYVNNSTITDAYFETGSGDIEIKNTQFESIDADTGSGDVILKNSTYQNGTFDTGSGDVKESRSI